MSWSIRGSILTQELSNHPHLTFRIDSFYLTEYIFHRMVPQLLFKFKGV